MGQRVIEALGIGTSATHMEWFFGPKGLRFSEIGCRPPPKTHTPVFCISSFTLPVAAKAACISSSEA